MSAPVLAEIWFGIIALEIGLYVLLDGADLGIGLISLFRRKEEARAPMMQVIGPIWDANETWLVLAGGTLFGAFPLAYGIILSALYIPVMTLIFGLIIRAAAFEFHEYSENKKFWSRVFGVGSLLAIVGQGTLVGGLISGIHVAHGVFVGGAWDFATLTTLAVVFIVALVYLLTGQAYLAHKESAPRTHSRVRYWISLLATGLAYTALTLLLMPYIAPPSVTIYQAASSPGTLLFMLYGIGPLVPIVFTYNLYLHRVFRDARDDERTEQYG